MMAGKPEKGTSPALGCLGGVRRVRHSFNPKRGTRSAPFKEELANLLLTVAPKSVLFPAKKGAQYTAEPGHEKGRGGIKTQSSTRC